MGIQYEIIAVDGEKYLAEYHIAQKNINCFKTKFTTDKFLSVIEWFELVEATKKIAKGFHDGLTDKLGVFKVDDQLSLKYSILPSSASFIDCKKLHLHNQFFIKIEIGSEFQLNPDTDAQRNQDKVSPESRNEKTVQTMVLLEENPRKKRKFILKKDISALDNLHHIPDDQIIRLVFFLFFLCSS